MEIVVVLLLMVLNGLFSMSEIAVVSSRRTRLEQDAKEDRPGATAALQLANEPNTFLSTVQVGMTRIGIVAAMVGEAAGGNREEKGIVPREEGSYLVDALVPPEEFVHYFGVPGRNGKKRFSDRGRAFDPPGPGNSQNGGPVCLARLPAGSNQHGQQPDRQNTGRGTVRIIGVA